VVVARHLVGKRESRRIEDACFGSEELEQPCGFFDAQPRKGPFTQRTVKQQDARRGVVGTKTEGRTSIRITPIERRQMVRVGERSKWHQLKLNRRAKAASVISRIGMVSVTPTRK